MSASEKSCERPPAPPVAWIHQIHAAGGASGAITIVMVFVRSLCLLCGFRLVTHQLDSSYTYVLEVLQSVPPRLAPYLKYFVGCSSVEMTGMPVHLLLLLRHTTSVVRPPKGHGWDSPCSTPSPVPSCRRQKRNGSCPCIACP